MLTVHTFGNYDVQVDTDGDTPRIANMSPALAHSLLFDALEDVPVDHEAVCGITAPHLGTALLVGDGDPYWLCMEVKEAHRELNSLEWFVFTSTRVRNIQYFPSQEVTPIGGRQAAILVHDYPLVISVAKHQNWLSSLKAANPELSPKKVPEGNHQYLVLKSLDDNQLIYGSEAPLEENWVESMAVITELGGSTELNQPIEAFISIEEDEVFDE